MFVRTKYSPRCQRIRRAQIIFVRLFFFPGSPSLSFGGRTVGEHHSSKRISCLVFWGPKISRGLMWAKPALTNESHLSPVSHFLARLLGRTKPVYWPWCTFAYPLAYSHEYPSLPHDDNDCDRKQHDEDATKVSLSMSSMSRGPRRRFSNEMTNKMQKKGQISFARRLTCTHTFSPRTREGVRAKRKEHNKNKSKISKTLKILFKRTYARTY